MPAGVGSPIDLVRMAVARLYRYAHASWRVWWRATPIRLSQLALERRGSVIPSSGRFPRFQGLAQSKPVADKLIPVRKEERQRSSVARGLSSSRSTSSIASPPSPCAGGVRITPISHTRTGVDRGPRPKSSAWRSQARRHHPPAQIVAGDGDPMRPSSGQRQILRTPRGSGLLARSVRRLENALENGSFGWNDSRHLTNYRPARRARCGACFA
jgi:hypothetical protein